MKKIFIIVLFVLIFVLSAFSVVVKSVRGKGPPPKVDVCHKEEETGNYSLMTVVVYALPGHLSHGDGFPGDVVPGIEGKKFAPDCSLVDARQFLGEFQVPATHGDGLTTGFSTVVGKTYDLEVSGIYTFWSICDGYPSCGIADAEYALRPEGSYNPGPDPQWILGEDVYPLSINYALDVLVNDQNVDWGVRNDLHEYETSIAGDGASIHFMIWDDYYDDNSGFLTVKVYER